MDVLSRLAAGRTDLVFELTGENPGALADARGVTVMQWCAYYGDVSALRYLVQRGASLELLGENLDLNGAAFHGHLQLSEYLIEQGADVNHPLPDTGETPLHAALCKTDARFEPVVCLLLAVGADPNRRTKPGVETGAFMRDIRTVGETPLHRAAAYASPAVIRALIDAGAQVDACDVHGDTPLTWASRHLRPRDVLRLLCYGPHRVS